MSSESWVMMLGALVAATIALSNAAADIDSTSNTGDLPLPRYEGRQLVTELRAPVVIERDDRANPTIRATSLRDAMLGLGFVHGQERYFSMDATRRLAAGELAELVGPVALSIDRDRRKYQFRDVAKRVLAQLPEEHRSLLDAYVVGINEGLASLPAPPIEYGIINAEPASWTAVDSILVILAMFDLLHIEGRTEMMAGVMNDALPEPMVDFLLPIVSRLDAPMLPSEGEAINGHAPALSIPGPDVFDLRAQAGDAAVDVPLDLVQTAPIVPGSNSWAVAGSRTRHGGAILANDPHLPYSVPGLWYRAELHWHGGGFAIGLTLPGVPGVVIGSNGQLAWGFTNTTGDFKDFVRIETDPDDPNRYRTPDGWERFETVTDEIAVRGRGPERIELTKTRWGVVTDHDHRGRPLALKWTAMDPDCIDLGVLDLMTARTLEQGVRVAAEWGGPSQNIHFASRDGRIAWVVGGRLPRRVGYTGRHPVSWAEGDCRWDGYYDGDDRPRLINPSDGVVFTANNRTVDPDWAARLGGIWASGERARRIGERLRAGEHYTERDMLDLQLDTTLTSRVSYRDLAIETIESLDVPDERDLQALAVLQDWNGAADVDQPAVRVIETFQRVLHAEVIGPLLAPARSLDPEFRYFWLMGEEPLHRVLEERPAHLLRPGFASWDVLLVYCWHRTLSLLYVPENGRDRDIDTPWGEVNRVQMRHPFSMINPAIARSWGMPADPQSGHHAAVRVARPEFGASARFVVSPGRENEGILHLPAGQSGHPMSPHYRDGHGAWLRGEVTPLRPGPTVAVFHLEPGAK